MGAGARRVRRAGARHAAPAIERAAADPSRATRVLSGDILAPVQPGPLEIRVRRLREAKNQSNLSAEATQSGQIVATASAVLSLARPRPERAVHVVAPSMPDVATVPLAPIAPPLGPAFAQHYELRPVTGIPFTGGEVAASTIFVRARVTEPLDAPAVVAHLDTCWPAVFPTLLAPRPMVTVAFTAEILADPVSVPPDAPLTLTVRALAERDGFVVELRELFHERTLIGLNQQTFAIVK